MRLCVRTSEIENSLLKTARNAIYWKSAVAAVLWQKISNHQ
jgi:hypothetical protein